MCNTTKTATVAGDPYDCKKTCVYPNGRIWLVLAAFVQKYRGDGFLDQIVLDKNKLTISFRKGEHPDKQIARIFVIQAKNIYTSSRFTDNELVCQIISGSIDPYTNFYTEIVLYGNKDGLDALTVLEALQFVRNKMYTSALDNLYTPEIPLNTMNVLMHRLRMLPFIGGFVIIFSDNTMAVCVVVVDGMN